MLPPECVAHLVRRRPLRANAPDGDTAAAAAAADRAGIDTRPAAGMVLVPGTAHDILRMDIERDRSVRMQAAFAFDAPPRPHGGRCTDFTIELLDAQGKRLRCNALFADDAGCGCTCATASWPLRIRHAVAFDALARTMVLYECDKELQRWPIEEPPKIELAVSGHEDAKAPDLHLQWKAQGEGAGRAMWFLVQWRDARGGGRAARFPRANSPRRTGDSMKLVAWRPSSGPPFVANDRKCPSPTNASRRTTVGSMRHCGP